MPKPHTLPRLFDEVNTLDISFLKKHGYLELNKQFTGTITWSRNGVETDSIGIATNTREEPYFVSLDYKCRNKSFDYSIYLISKPSNLGKGLIWYFKCPFTNKLCRKLYSIECKFAHRSAFPSCMYDCQTLSKRDRAILKRYKPYFQSEKIHAQLYKKHLKKHYKGKPTKKYSKLKELERQADSVQPYEIESCLIK